MSLYMMELAIVLCKVEVLRHLRELSDADRLPMYMFCSWEQQMYWRSASAREPTSLVVPCVSKSRWIRLLRLCDWQKIFLLWHSQSSECDSGRREELSRRTLKALEWLCDSGGDTKEDVYYTNAKPSGSATISLETGDVKTLPYQVHETHTCSTFIHLCAPFAAKHLQEQCAHMECVVHAVLKWLRQKDEAETVVERQSMAAAPPPQQYYECHG
jgi:hypothetical protein